MWPSRTLLRCCTAFLLHPHSTAGLWEEAHALRSNLLEHIRAASGVATLLDVRRQGARGDHWCLIGHFCPGMHRSACLLTGGGLPAQRLAQLPPGSAHGIPEAEEVLLMQGLLRSPPCGCCFPSAVEGAL